MHVCMYVYKHATRLFARGSVKAPPCTMQTSTRKRIECAPAISCNCAMLQSTNDRTHTHTCIDNYLPRTHAFEQCSIHKRTFIMHERSYRMSAGSSMSPMGKTNPFVAVDCDSPSVCCEGLRVFVCSIQNTLVYAFVSMLLCKSERFVYTAILILHL